MAASTALKPAPDAEAPRICGMNYTPSYAPNDVVTMRDFDTFLHLCDRQGLTALPVLFDSCFGDEPSIDSDGHWAMNPGATREVASFWPRLQR